ncbi:cardiolipin synthase ClsB [Parvibium lacunae]|uniref:Cardiolipin synthase B n=1 Tax=Parvibium lacunae TaxID=1888893 RepID=A0A368KYQ2_9BURK|nr:cardiolipin synthase ClsB [Parvibium lacunae]RCS56547.1 cardiolipin synthase ClsB [Parvibium lacunae]
MTFQPDWHNGNQLHLLPSGAAYFTTLLEAIAQAQVSIYLETYIFAADAVGEAVAQALTAAAQRGVKVYLVVDGFGTLSIPVAWRLAWQQAGVALRIFRPEGPHWLWRWRWGLNANRQRLRRMHRKITVIDQQLAFLGGINIQDDHMQGDGTRLAQPRYDFAVQVQGPVVQPILALVMRQWWQLDWLYQMRPEAWYHVPWRQYARARREDWQRFWAQQRATSRVIASAQKRHTGLPQRAALVIRDNLRHRHAIESAYLQAIGQAQQEIILANAYFFPGWRFRQALCEAASRGVRVILLLQGQSEHPIQFYGSQVLYRELLHHGIEIYEYLPSFLHAKVAVIDSESRNTWATVGSSNIDPYSLLLAREANLVVQDPAFSQHLRACLQEGLAAARPVRLVDLERLPWWRRGLCWLGYGMLRLGLVLSGLASQYQK